MVDATMKEKSEAWDADIPRSFYMSGREAGATHAELMKANAMHQLYEYVRGRTQLVTDAEMMEVFEAGIFPYKYLNVRSERLGHANILAAHAAGMDLRLYASVSLFASHSETLEAHAWNVDMDVYEARRRRGATHVAAMTELANDYEESLHGQTYQKVEAIHRQ